MSVRKGKTNTDYDRIHKELEEKELQERISEIENCFLSLPPIEVWYESVDYASDSAVYNPDGSKKEPIKKIREREHIQTVAQVASSRRQFNSNQRQYSQRNQSRQNRCTNQRGRR